MYISLTDSGGMNGYIPCANWLAFLLIYSWTIGLNNIVATAIDEADK